MLENVINEIYRISKADARLSSLLIKTREYTDVYLLARKRQKGCDGLGEIALGLCLVKGCTSVSPACDHCWLCLRDTDEGR